MPIPVWSPVITYLPPPSNRQVPGFAYAASTTFKAREMKISKSWGLQPAECEITYVVAGPVSVGGQIKCDIGGHIFWGFCANDLPNLSTGEGNISQMRFVDMRELLDWDIVTCCFNKLEILQEGDVRIKRYWHIYPNDFRSNVKTYTSGPLSAAQVLAAILGAPTVESPWIVYYCHPTTGTKTIGYHPALTSYPAYDIDCMNGPKLGAAIQMVLDQVGLVCTIISDNTAASAYHLTFARKGEGILPSFPSNSNNRRLGKTLSKVPTRLRVIGERNRYQLHDIGTPNGNLVADWATGWEAFFGDTMLLRDWIFDHMNMPSAVAGIPANTPYKNIPGDVEFIIGKQLAQARALTMTVAEFATARDAISADGNSFRDYRKCQGKTRMLMPAALYVTGLVFRAFRLADTFEFTNSYDNLVDVSGIELVPELMAEVTHNHSTGQLFWDVLRAADGPGYGIVQGFMAGADAFKGIRPDRFDIDKFTSMQDVWNACSFQVDDSGSFDGQYIVFDEPLIRTGNLFTKGLNSGDILDLNGHAALNANATFSVPPVKVALCMRAEKFVWDVGVGTRDESMVVPNLQDDFIGLTDDNVVIPYTDGQTAAQKATNLGNSFLARQWYFHHGGFDRPMIPNGSGVFTPTQMNGSIDRITVSIDTKEGLKERVDFTGERSFMGFVPERVFDRGERDKGLYPGQKALQEEANQLSVAAVALKRDPRTLNAIVELFAGYRLKEVTPDRTSTTKTPAQVKAYTPMKKKPNTLSGVITNTSAVVYGDSTYSVFVGVNMRHNDTGTTLRVADHGEVPVRVKGPVVAQDSLGLSSDTSADYLIKNGAGAAGIALQAIPDATTKVIMVRLGGGAGGVIQFRGEFDKALAYGSMDMVSVSLGIEAGTYIALKPVPANAANDLQYLPWAGTGYWKKLALLTDQAQFI